MHHAIQDTLPDRLVNLQRRQLGLLDLPSGP